MLCCDPLGCPRHYSPQTRACTAATYLKRLALACAYPAGIRTWFRAHGWKLTRLGWRSKTGRLDVDPCAGFDKLDEALYVLAAQAGCAPTDVLAAMLRAT